MSLKGNQMTDFLYNNIGLERNQAILGSQILFFQRLWSSNS